jgi:acetyltransferase AlgX (SGNH hydrolase-like protein)
MRTNETRGAEARAAAHGAARGGGRRALGQAGRALAGLAIGLAAAEGLFWYRDGGAFPHLNVYEPDADLGLRLRPLASQSLSAGPNNPRTRVRVNREGFRGADWPAPAPGETLVVGDSQVFGLGVEESETFSAALARRLGPGAVVLNAGVPTYGPPEFLRVVEQALAARQVGTVVYVVNLVNDLFEAERPNAGRHAVWDGWAVRRENAPAGAASFPGRSLLMRESHAVFALRRLLHGGASSSVDPGLPSEGGFRDLLGAGEATEAERARAEEETARRAAEQAKQIDEDARRLEQAEQRVDRLVERHVAPDLNPAPNSPEGPNAGIYNEQLITYRAGRADPGDIVGEDDRPEGGRSVAATAAMIRRGARLREAYERKLRERAAKDPALAAEVEGALGERDRGREELRQKRLAPREIVRAPSPIARQIARVKAACDARGARLLVVALPMDVQVSPDEWKKYGLDPVDMSEARVLVDDLVESARSLGALALDATAALAAAEPGAFLAGDLHMTPKGHEALAGAIEGALMRPPPPPPAAPRGGLPPGRSRVPTAAEWHGQYNGPYGSEESSYEGYGLKEQGYWDNGFCTVQRVREWFRVSCFSLIRAAPAADAFVLEGGRGEAFSPMLPRNAQSDVDPLAVASVIAPLAPGERLVADMRWAQYSKRVTIDWPAGALEPSFSAGPVVRGATPVRRSERESAYCACQKERTKKAACDLSDLADDPDCLRTYANDCEGLLACLAGHPASPPRCGPGHANAGARERCLKLCGEGASCAEGVCTPWQGGNVCMGGGAPR